ncbi:Glycosyltransferase involved in cell wall bisynthesis [Ruminococcaceae bacterium KH2T8]|nr:Glycosyltransferase involved in cell wall bisynthesis [Ruminococcaceae bacterium KH2T8]
MRICFVVQRYGDEVNGGAEVHARQLAEHVAQYTDHEVEVATTKAIDYVTWRNEYENDEDIVNGLKVHRFPVVNERVQEKFNKISEKVAAGQADAAEQEKWMKLQGPECPALIEWLKANKDNYDRFVFLTYLYYTTYYGLQAVGKKAVLIPTAHEEWTIHIPMFRKMFELPGAFFYNTTEEKELVNRLFNTSDIPDNEGIGGVGVEVPENVSAEAFREKFGIKDKFIIYVGRIDENKCCPELFTYFREYKNRHKDSSLKLVLAGKEIIKVPKADDIISLGFVSEEDKFNAIAASEFLVLPSRFESLSIVVLEALKLRRPALVTAGCNVLVGHCRRSNAALYYNGYYEFEGCIDYLLSHEDECRAMGENGVKYVDTNYSWKNIVDRLNGIMTSL